MITPGTADLDCGSWLARWDAQQERYIADREGRFEVLFDALEAALGGDPATVLDLGCGPGSLGVRLLERFRSARVIGVEVDPVLLALGRGAYGDREHLTFVRADLRDDGWLDSIGVDRVDAATSSTALHWLGAETIRRLSADLARVIRPGGVFLDADHVRFGPGDARLSDVARRMTDLELARRGTAAAEGESWEEWWQAIRAEPALAGALAERDALGHAGHHGRHALSDDDQRLRLREAGFAATDVVWRRGADRVLAALR
ncbi:MAG TPA: class I SAM-dependent methyltransferase [Terriglobales bacterium]|nr:class I SAM-dependent methyltransferase [Terriglobales bacterium]